MNDKKCPRCAQSKPRGSFGKNKSRSDGLAVWCKACQRQYAQQWRKKNPGYDNKPTIDELEPEQRRARRKYMREYMRDYRQTKQWKESQRADPVPGLVYFIRESGKGYIKVGITRDNPEQRMALMQTDNPHDLSLLAYIETDDCYGVESAIHNHIAEKKVRGEWFNITAHEACDLVDQFCK